MGDIFRTWWPFNVATWRTILWSKKCYFRVLIKLYSHSYRFMTTMLNVGQSAILWNSRKCQGCIQENGIEGFHATNNKKAFSGFGRFPHLRFSLCIETTLYVFVCGLTTAKLRWSGWHCIIGCKILWIYQNDFFRMVLGRRRKTNFRSHK